MQYSIFGKDYENQTAVLMRADVLERNFGSEWSDSDATEYNLIREALEITPVDQAFFEYRD